MNAMTVLFSTDVGLMSLAVIAVTLGMGAFYLRYFLKHMREDSARAAAEAKAGR
ncbi:DUF3149 domain-containing protein [Rubrivivax gelatinosus]|uniref:DUF3149 domain-containing protein n=1 Tax=Rubrivivax gelatinosus (strain NBRC 100245 / IL144) TaxID=983917 RepID=I0HT99_RUBGI|nr:DUF3149 domain-containing protein [Rubrivivax gelatinosus]MBG6082785.1 putative membrane-anchored protein [Rubrivivax gelatinosus]BAL96236.1 hypothetical protein RGE_28970 [Rubrivivax gelatinosus IL144]